MKQLILLFTSCLYHSLISAAPQRPSEKGKFPLPLPDLPPYELATPAYAFDGIDYNELPEKLRVPYTDCYGHWLSCVRNRTQFNYVCAYKLQQINLIENGFWGWYYSQCEIELQNCETRVYYGHGVYGTHYTNDNIFYSGGGAYCEKNVPKEDPNKTFD